MSAQVEKSWINIMDMDRASMEVCFLNLGEKKFRAKQIMQWLYQRELTDFSRMTDLSKSFRARLVDGFFVDLPEVVTTQRSFDGTVKWLLKLKDNNCIETVYIPESDRGTLCVSSQVGCGLNCTFCATAQQGFNRNLNLSEIIAQVWVANNQLSKLGYGLFDNQFADETAGQLNNAQVQIRRPVTNVVMMGMGEPLLNFDPVVGAMNLMMDDFAYGLSKRRVTLSTAGMVPAIERLKQCCPVSLAVSLHAPDDALRDQLVPLNKKYPIAVLLDACRSYVGAHNRQRVTFEYVMLKDVNDGKAQAKKLADLLQDVPAKVNLIPFNPFSNTCFKRSSNAAIDRFRDVLLSRNIFTMTRKTRGQEIDAACGQLAGDFKDRTRRSEKSVTKKNQTATLQVKINAKSDRKESRQWLSIS